MTTIGLNGGVIIEAIKESTSISETSDEAKQIPSLEDALLQLSTLVGMKNLKKELKSVLKIVQFQKDIIANKSNIKLFPFHYIFSIDKSNGITTALRFVSIIFYHLGIIKSPDFKEYTMDDIYSITEYEDTSNLGLIALHGIEKYEDIDKELYEKLLNKMSDSYGETVFVLIMPTSDKEKCDKLISKLSFRINCRYIYFSPYSDKELTQIGMLILANYGCQIKGSAEKCLKERIIRLRKDSSFQNIKTVESLVHSVRIEKLFNSRMLRKGKNMNISASDFPSDDVVGKSVCLAKLAEDYKIIEASNKFDSMVGMKAIKEKIEEIAANLVMQKKLNELGIDNTPICLHMQFAGNPGTGKTTAARLTGKIFKEAGLLEKGDFFEVSREDLVGKYLGFTAVQTKEKIEEAMGSVLFIDEAYSLVLDKEDMYGHEAIATLVKEMENKRDKLVIIFAGYTKEMNELLKTNPGLRDRIPHKIQFPDYSADELVEIFRTLLGKEYSISQAVIDRLKYLFQCAVANADSHFGNGRFARNIVDRLKMKQAKRLFAQKTYSKEDLLTIQDADVEELFNEPDIKKYINKSKGKRIGFI